ncbi:hypothetical protein IJI94_00085 [Candidatus Saccharibacteria bacterium]|nr:hypothetical protein [Candidatus Saccharibacteria bacterium]
MMAFAMLQWWYTRGWKIFITKLIDKLRGAADFFSISLLIRTLFAPFKQIDAGGGGDSLGDRLHAFGDRLISRLVGAVMRIGILIFGLILLILESVVGLALIIIWPFLPLVPVAGIYLTCTGFSLW